MAIKRCPDAVATGVLHDPYTNQTISFVRGAQVGAAVQIDHIVPLAYAWDMGARDWNDAMRVRFANDPANLLAVAGQANQDKGDQPPAAWMRNSAVFNPRTCKLFIRYQPVGTQAFQNFVNILLRKTFFRQLSTDFRLCPAGSGCRRPDR